MSKVRTLSLIVLFAMLLGACSPQKQNLGEEFLQIITKKIINE